MLSKAAPQLPSAAIFRHQLINKGIESDLKREYIIEGAEVDVTMTNIYGFLHFGEYLQADFQRRKGRNGKYSYRAMAEKLGLSSSTVVRIMNGKRGLSKSMIPRFVAYLNLGKREAQYFANLVTFHTAKSEHTRLGAYRELITLRNKRTRTISQDQYHFYQEWYYTAIRELLRINNFSGDFEELANSLIPGITAIQAHRAVDMLLQSGLIEKINSSYVVKSGNVSTGEVWQSAAIHNFQLTLAKKAIEALQCLPREERDFSTMTMCYSKQGFEKVRDLLKHTREELKRIEEADEKENRRVYQINLQLFPLSRPSKGAQLWKFHIGHLNFYFYLLLFWFHAVLIELKSRRVLKPPMESSLQWKHLR